MWSPYVTLELPAGHSRPVHCSCMILLCSYVNPVLLRPLIPANLASGQASYVYIIDKKTFDLSCLREKVIFSIESIVWVIIWGDYEPPVTGAGGGAAVLSLALQHLLEHQVLAISIRRLHLESLSLMADLFSLISHCITLTVILCLSFSLVVSSNNRNSFSSLACSCSKRQDRFRYFGYILFESVSFCAYVAWWEAADSEVIVVMCGLIHDCIFSPCNKSAGNTDALYIT